MERLNAPYGARCFLTEHPDVQELFHNTGLNAPYGARCFLTKIATIIHITRNGGLNAPYGARCFLTNHHGCSISDSRRRVLMHLMALGAF